MSLTKSNISQNIANETSISKKSAQQLLDKFIQVVVFASYESSIKISGFGTFSRKSTPSRIGRNPKTGEEYKITERTKLKFFLSNKIKEKLNK